MDTKQKGRHVKEDSHDLTIKSIRVVDLVKRLGALSRHNRYVVHRNSAKRRHLVATNPNTKRRRINFIEKPVDSDSELSSDADTETENEDGVDHSPRHRIACTGTRIHAMLRAIDEKHLSTSGLKQTIHRLPRDTSTSALVNKTALAMIRVVNCFRTLQATGTVHEVQLVCPIPRLDAEHSENDTLVVAKGVIDVLHIIKTDGARNDSECANNDRLQPVYIEKVKTHRDVHGYYAPVSPITNESHELQLSCYKYMLARNVWAAHGHFNRFEHTTVTGDTDEAVARGWMGMCDPKSTVSPHVLNQLLTISGAGNHRLGLLMKQDESFRKPEREITLGRIYKTLLCYTFVTVFPNPRHFELQCHMYVTCYCQDNIEKELKKTQN